MNKPTSSEFQKFDTVMKKILSVSHKELQAREQKYKRNRVKRKRPKTSGASREAT